MIYIFDIDDTILVSTDNDYKTAVPIPGRIEFVNNLFDLGHTIVYWTARGAQTGIDWSTFTRKQLKGFGCKYSDLRFNKPHYDVWVDDKAFNDNSFFPV